MQNNDSDMASWPNFTLVSECYTFGHLVDFTFVCFDSSGTERSVLVTFTDHVFTRDEVAGDLAASAFPNCSRTPRGYLCPDRYRMSLQLPGLISGVASQRVWNLTGEDRYAQVPIVDDQGVRRLLRDRVQLGSVEGFEDGYSLDRAVGAYLRPESA